MAHTNNTLVASSSSIPSSSQPPINHHDGIVSESTNETCVNGRISHRLLPCNRSEWLDVWLNKRSTSFYATHMGILVDDMDHVGSFATQQESSSSSNGSGGPREVETWGAPHSDYFIGTPSFNHIRFQDSSIVGDTSLQQLYHKNASSSSSSNRDEGYARFVPSLVTHIM
jgi:hypothetical protein